MRHRTFAHAFFVTVLAVLTAGSLEAAIPQAERDALVQIYDT